MGVLVVVVFRADLRLKLIVLDLFTVDIYVSIWLKCVLIVTWLLCKTLLVWEEHLWTTTTTSPV